ncbi:D-alanyl-D-alanine carboxypeptidase [Streptacidiphilus jiangxiensis]|uniref:D-alanyl-D-alanine carboxypeptidase n=1 Tax=Streptacidiphilus jiangxiensis TaxID=235985 RepID=A0A1H7UKE6_STRJI|nr:D-alanyl-D-alanine carboxypeptidase [Streptacidiphilus jiangxiensis]
MLGAPASTRAEPEAETAYLLAAPAPTRAEPEAEPAVAQPREEETRFPRAAPAPAPAPLPFDAPIRPVPYIDGPDNPPSRFPRLWDAVSRMRGRNARVVAVGGVGVVAVAVVAAVALGSGPAHTSGGGSAAGTAGSSAPAAPRLRLTVPASLTVPGHLDLAWPATGQAAIAVTGVGLLGSSGPVDTPKSIASVTKTMTAYLILKDHPLAPGQSGPTLTITPAEAAALPEQQALHQSLVPVRSGERFTERQALQALMLASADNMAEVLAAWDSGSQSRFVARMNATAVSLGMGHTHFSQPSGYLGTSVSTATDLVKLGEVAITDPFFADLVDESSAVIPGGAIRNYNALLGEYGIDGIKTGSTYWAGGCLLFSARTRVAGHEVTLVGAVLGQPGNITTMLPSVFAATTRLLRSADHALKRVTVVGTGRTVAQLSGLAGGDGSPELLRASRAVTLIGWPGLRLALRLSGAATAHPELLAVTPDGRTAVTTPLVTTPPASG